MQRTCGSGVPPAQTPDNRFFYAAFATWLRICFIICRMAAT